VAKFFVANMVRVNMVCGQEIAKLSNLYTVVYNSVSDTPTEFDIMFYIGYLIELIILCYVKCLLHYSASTINCRKINYVRELQFQDNDIAFVDTKAVLIWTLRLSSGGLGLDLGLKVIVRIKVRKRGGFVLGIV